jgi:hypothetical protein
VDIFRYFVHPAMKDWFVQSDFHKTDYMDQFLATALTYAFLYKFGGTVATFDVFFRRPIRASGQFLSRCTEDDVIEQYPITLEAKHPFLQGRIYIAVCFLTVSIFTA